MPWDQPTLVWSSCQGVSVLQEGSLALCPASSLERAAALAQELGPPGWSGVQCIEAKVC